MKPGNPRRVALIALTLLLLAGTTLAFGVTQSLKLERSPVTGPRFDQIFSPTCGCPTDTAQLSFRLRRPDRVDAVLVNGKGDPVRTLASDLRRSPGRVTFLWNGRNESGEIVPDGRYRLRVHLRQSRRTILIPTPVKVDTDPPALRILRTTRPVISPDGDHRHDRFSIFYRIDEQARLRLEVDGKRASVGRLSPPGRSRFDWHGRVAGRPQGPGKYLLSLVVVDRAGNSSPRSEPILVSLRFATIVGGPLAARRNGDDPAPRRHRRRGLPVVDQPSREPSARRPCRPAAGRDQASREAEAGPLHPRGGDRTGEGRQRDAHNPQGETGSATMIESWERVLVLAPHTDDGEFGCGGTMARLVDAGTEVRYVAFSIATKSLPAGFPPDTLAREVREATAVIGLPDAALTVHDFEVRAFPERRQDILELLIQLWEEWHPDAVFMPSLRDIHQDHQVVSAEGLRAFKRTTLLGYEIPWNTFNFDQQAYLSFESEHLERKVRALECYASQQHRNYANPEYIRNLARTHGLNVNRDFAEVFEVYRVVG